MLTLVQKRLLKIMDKGHIIILDDFWHYYCGPSYRTNKNDLMISLTGTYVDKRTIRVLQKGGILDKDIDAIGLIQEINLTKKGKEIAENLKENENE